MEISLTELEIVEAIKGFVELTGIPLKDQNVTVELKAGRGEKGHTAHIQILPAAEDSPKDGEDKPTAEDDQAIDFEFESED